jgi:outer membrane protein assembly factor BamE (lipoprotein component of BamABCDE complex)
MISFVYRKHKVLLYIIFFSITLNNCQLKEPIKSHGINFLDNRYKNLTVGKTNKNDVIMLIGNPHTTSISSNDTWIYFERTITRGDMIKLGQNVLKKNNIVELKFDKYGILSAKNNCNKENMNKIKYSEKTTKNINIKKSFVSKFLSSVKQKMYGNRK